MEQGHRELRYNKVYIRKMLWNASFPLISASTSGGSALTYWSDTRSQRRRYGRKQSAALLSFGRAWICLVRGPRICLYAVGSSAVSALACRFSVRSNAMTKPQDHSVGEQPTNPIITDKWVYCISNIQREYPARGRRTNPLVV